MEERGAMPPRTRGEGNTIQCNYSRVWKSGYSAHLGHQTVEAAIQMELCKVEFLLQHLRNLIACLLLASIS
jgi:hypothetical protein